MGCGREDRAGSQEPHCGIHIRDGNSFSSGAGRATGKKWTVLVIICGTDSSPQWALQLYLEKYTGKGNFVTPVVDLQVHFGEAAET